jgi:RNA polymerase sigma-70 factor (ECF subfamily)
LEPQSPGPAAPSPRRDARDDVAFMRDIAAGDSTALAALYDRYSAIVYALCLRITHNRDDADDLLVEIFFELWHKSARYDAARSRPLTYLLTLARSRAIDRRRGRPKAIVTPLDETDPRTLKPSAPNPDEPARLAEWRAAVTRSLADLDENQRTAIQYSFWDDLSHTEIAARLNKPLGTVKTWIRQGLSKLRTALRDHA